MATSSAPSDSPASSTKPRATTALRGGVAGGGTGAILRPRLRRSRRHSEGDPADAGGGCGVRGGSGVWGAPSLHKPSLGG